MKLTVTEYAGDMSRELVLEDCTLTEAVVLIDTVFNDSKAQESSHYNVQENVSDSGDEEQDVHVNHGGVYFVNWSKAPDWATGYGEIPSGAKVWFNKERYCYTFDEGGYGYYFGKDLHKPTDIKVLGVRP